MFQTVNGYVQTAVHQLQQAVADSTSPLKLPPASRSRGKSSNGPGIQISRVPIRGRVNTRHPTSHSCSSAFMELNATTLERQHHHGNARVPRNNSTDPTTRLGSLVHNSGGARTPKDHPMAPSETDAWSDMWRSEWVMRVCKQPSIAARLWQRQGHWIGHMLRMGDDCIAPKWFFR